MDNNNCFTSVQAYYTHPKYFISTCDDRDLMIVLANKDIKFYNLLCFELDKTNDTRIFLDIGST